MGKKNVWLMGILLSSSFSAHAELPLTLEDLITEKGKIKMDLSISYANSNRQGVSVGSLITIQTDQTSFITLPSLVGESQVNSDSMVGTVGLRYGLTSKAEISGRTSYLYSSTRSSDVSGIRMTHDTRFADAWVGINYQFKDDDNTPSILGFAEIALREKHLQSSSSFKSAMVGISANKAIDPIVISITTAYQANQTRQDGTHDYKPGNLFLISPSIAFAVNDRVTLTTGMQWTSRQADKWDGHAQDFRRTSSDLLLGASYGVSKASIVSLTFISNVSGSNGANLRLNWQHAW